MRISRIVTAAAVTAAFVTNVHPLQAQDRGSVSVVTGYSVAQGSPLTDIVSAATSDFSSNLNFGGRAAFNVAPGFQAFGEVGRMGNVLPRLVTSAFSLVADVRASSVYADGGIRAFLGNSAVTPYVEASTGISRMNLRVAGVSNSADAVLGLGLGFIDRTSPEAGLGAGVLAQSGRLMFDAGYRYKKIFAKDLVSTLFSGGDSLTSHQIAFSAGVRF
jgi:hypothetical protein